MKVSGGSDVMVGLAGWSGDDGSGGSDGAERDSDQDNGDSTGDDGAEGTYSGSQDSPRNGGEESGNQKDYVQELTRSVGRDDIPGLGIVGWESEVTNGGSNVRVAMRNTGDQQTDVREYTRQIASHDENGTELDTTGSAVAYPGETGMGPGAVRFVASTPSIGADPGPAPSHEALLHCDGPFAEGIYCPS